MASQLVAKEKPLGGEPQDHDYSPFCSKRCADLDLSRWLGGRYAIPGAPAGKVETDFEDDPDGGSNIPGGPETKRPSCFETRR